jgi:integrase
MRKGDRVVPSTLTLAEFADEWFAAQTALRPNTRRIYSWGIENHIKPRLGRLRVTEVTTDDVSRLIGEMQADGLKPWTIRAVITPLSRILGNAARRGMISSNPVKRLERGERPSVGRREIRVLSRDEISRLLEHAPDQYRTLLSTAIFSGLRISELLGLTWGDVDFDAGVIRVRKQLQDRKPDGAVERLRVEPKTPQAIRDVMLLPSLGDLLREHRRAALWTKAGDLVFASATGAGLDSRNVTQRGLEKALAAAEIEQEGRVRITFHQLRHVFASLLIAQGLNVTFVSRQLGHANPAITLGIYAHLFDQLEHATKASAALEASFGGMLQRRRSPTLSPDRIEGPEL